MKGEKIFTPIKICFETPQEVSVIKTVLDTIIDDSNLSMIKNISTKTNVEFTDVQRILAGLSALL